MKSYSFSPDKNFERKNSLFQVRSVLEETLLSAIEALESSNYRESFNDELFTLPEKISEHRSYENGVKNKPYLNIIFEAEKVETSSKRTELYSTLKDLNSLLEKQF